MTKELKTQKRGHATRHDENITALYRIEGQIRGIQRMIEQGAYCIDIVTQIQAAQAALGSVGRKILKKHLEQCVAETMKSKSKAAAAEKIDELMGVLKRSVK